MRLAVVGVLIERYEDENVLQLAEA